MHNVLYLLPPLSCAGGRFSLDPRLNQTIYTVGQRTLTMFVGVVSLCDQYHSATTPTNIVIQKQTITCWLRHHWWVTPPAYRDHYRVFPFPVHSLANRCRPECDGTPMRMLQRNRGNQHQEGSHQPVLPCRFLTSADLAAIFKISKIILGNPSLVTKDLY